MNKHACSVCQKTKSLNQCESCGDTVCKSCTQFIGEDTFKYQVYKPKNVQHNIYCPTCYNEYVAEAVDQYTNTLDAANNIIVFEKTQSKETRLMKRLEDPIKLQNETDRHDALMKMAFIAVQRHFNAIIDVEITPQKVRDGSYQTTIYTCSAIPVTIEDRHIIKDRSFRSSPN